MAEYSTNTFEMTFYLDSFRGARTIEQEDENGNMEHGVFIPYERNGIILTPNRHPITWGFVQELDVAQRGFTHRVLQKTNPKFVKEERSKGFEGTILIARMKPTKFYHRKRNNGYQRVSSDGIDL